MALTPSNKRPSSCIGKLNRVKNVNVSDIVTAFTEDNPECFTVYKNFDFTTPYKALISEGKAIKNGYPYKNFLSYPYEEFKFQIGDYVSFEYGGSLKHWCIKSLDRQRTDNCMGHVWLCNNIVRWRNEYGKVFTYPCVFEENIQRPSPRYNEVMVVSSGLDECFLQYNKDTKQLKVNDRLLFDGDAYKITSIGDHNRDDIYDEDSCMGLRLILEQCQVEDEVDDKERNLANGLIPIPYTIEVDKTLVNDIVGTIGKINATVKYNGNPVDEEVVFELVEKPKQKQNCRRYGYCCKAKDDVQQSCITIDNEGNYTLDTLGTETVKVYMKNNDDIYVNVSFEVVDVPTVVPVKEEIVLSGYREIYEEETVNYTVAKLIDGVDNGEVLAIEDVSNDGEGYYEIIIGTNSFSITNLCRRKEKVIIKITDSVGNYIEEEITLKGLF